MLCILRARRLCLFSGVFFFLLNVREFKEISPLSTLYGGVVSSLPNQSKKKKKTGVFPVNTVHAAISRCVSINLEIAQKLQTENMPNGNAILKKLSHDIYKESCDVVQCIWTEQIMKCSCVSRP